MKRKGGGQRAEMVLVKGINIVTETVIVIDIVTVTVTVTGIGTDTKITKRDRVLEIVEIDDPEVKTGTIGAIKTGREIEIGEEIVTVTGEEVAPEIVTGTETEMMKRIKKNEKMGIKRRGLHLFSTE